MAAEPVLGGVYELADSPEEVAASQAEAVERSAAALPWLSRIFARPVLRRAVWTCGELEVGVDGGVVSVRCDDKAPVSVPLDGSRVSGLSPTGQDYEAWASLEGTVVQITFETDLGQRRSELDLGAETTRCKRQVVNAQLPVPLAWETVYRAR